MGTAISCVPSKGFPIEVVVMSLGDSRFKKCRNMRSAAHHLHRAFFPTHRHKFVHRAARATSSREIWVLHVVSCYKIRCQNNIAFYYFLRILSMLRANTARLNNFNCAGVFFLPLYRRITSFAYADTDFPLRFAAAVNDPAVPRFFIVFVAFPIQSFIH